MVKRCGCISGPAALYQNARYGVGMRVHTVGFKVLRCTVCGHETENPDQAKKPEAKKGKK